MARKIVSIPGLPQLPVGSADDKARYETDLLRVLWAWKRSLDQLIDENNTGDEGGGGHIIQEEGVDLPDQDRLNFIGAAVTAADDPSNGRTNVTVVAGTSTATVEEITATAPIVVTPDPITVSGDISHAASGVTAATYGDVSHVPQIAVNATGHVTSATEIVIPNNTGMTVGDSWLWGSGRDGVLDFNGSNTFAFAALVSGAYYLKRCVHGTNVTIRSGVRVSTWDYSGTNLAGGGGQLFATGTLHIEAGGMFDGNGGTSLGKANASVATWSPYTTSEGLYGNGGSGGTGNTSAGSPGGSRGQTWGGSAGAGGAGSTGTAGGLGGTATAPTDAETGGVNTLWTISAMQFGRFPRITAGFALIAGGAGGGGGGGAGGWHGGGGGAGGAPIGVFARHITGSGVISSDGGAGANGDYEDPRPGGGGGGGGGVVMCITATASIPVTIRANGGAAGPTSGSGNPGIAGSAGVVAILYVGVLA